MSQLLIKSQDIRYTKLTFAVRIYRGYHAAETESFRYPWRNW